jgi:ABC-type Fe3+-hydroxamate transport system substrate-binding protein
VDDPRNSAKREAFIRLADRRTNTILEKIRILGNLSNPYAYDYSDDDVKKIFAAIDREMRLTRTKFQNQQKRKFKLEGE